MNNNSIKNNLDLSSCISQIKLLFSENKKNSFLIVEGENDIRFFKTNKSENCFIIESFSGKTGVKDIVAHFNDNRVIGVIDRDYYDIKNNDFLFFYDYSCLEMMLISQKESFINALKIISLNFYELDFLDKIFNALLWISLFRKLSKTYSAAINFKGINLIDCYNKKLNIMDNEKIFDELKKRNKKLITTLLMLKQKVDKLSQKKFNEKWFFYCTQGHDFFCMLKFFLDLKEKTPINQKTLLIGLITGFNFNTTKLYQTILEHENKTNIIFLTKNNMISEETNGKK